MPSEAEVNALVREVFAPPESVIHSSEEIEAARQRLIAQMHPEPEMPSESQVNAMIDSMFPAPKLNTWEYRASGSPAPQPTEEVTSLAQMVRSFNGTRDVHFSPEQGVTLMFGYSGLTRVMPGHRYVHIATVDELAATSDQQIYDAVKQAGNGR